MRYLKLPTCAALPLIGVLAVFAFDAALIGSALKLRQAVPVSDQDLKDASWLIGGSAVHQIALMSSCISALMCLLGLWISVVQRRWTNFLVAAGLGCALFMVGRPPVQFIVAAAQGDAKIGCFVWETRECRAMFGMSSKDVPSMYVPRAEADRTGEVLTPAYQQAFKNIKAAETRSMWHLDELNAKLNAQRAELARRRAAEKASISVTSAGAGK